MSDESTPKSIITKLASIFSLTKTATRILDLLLHTKEKLMVREIAERVKSSERNVRKHLVLLLQKGLLGREVEITKNKKLAFKYFINSTEEILSACKRELSTKLTELEQIILKSKKDKVNA